MTTVVAVETKDGVTFAADSRISWYSQHDGWIDKIVKNGPFTFGAAGALRAIQILEYAKLPEPPKTKDSKILDRFVTKELVGSIKDAFRDVDSDADGVSDIIGAVRGRLYVFSSDGAWVRNPDGFYAIGSGAPYALGALKAGATPKRAVKIASIYDSGTNDDVRVVKHDAR
jgi:20S proteasome alpha/beta subunit